MQLVFEIWSEIFYSLKIAFVFAKRYLLFFIFAEIFFLASLLLNGAACMSHPLLQSIQKMFLLFAKEGRMLASFVAIGDLCECLKLVCG